MYYPDELIEEVRQCRRCRIRLCPSAEKGEFLFRTVSVS